MLKLNLFDYTGGDFICQDLSAEADKVLALYNGLDFLNESSGFDGDIIEGYASAAIEGARTTPSAVRNGLSVSPSDKGTKMCVNCVDVFRRFGKIDDHASFIMKEWYNLTFGVLENASVGFDSGTGYRKGMVYVGNHVPASPDKITQSMWSLLNFVEKEGMHPLIKASVAHFYIAYVHPFCDGNGRFARYFQNKVLYNNGLENIWNVPVSLFILGRQSAYYAALRASEVSLNGVKDITPFIRFMLSVYEAAFKSQAYGKYTEWEIVLYEWVKHSLSSFSAYNAAAYLGVVYSTARKICKRMSERGMLEATRNGKTIYYKMSV